MSAYARRRVLCTNKGVIQRKDVKVKRWMCTVKVLDKNTGEEKEIEVPSTEDHPIGKCYQNPMTLTEARQILKERKEKQEKKGTRGSRKSSAKSSAKHSAAVTDDEGPPVPMDDTPAPAPAAPKRTMLFPNYKKGQSAPKQQAQKKPKKQPGLTRYR